MQCFLNNDKNFAAKSINLYRSCSLGRKFNAGGKLARAPFNERARAEGHLLRALYAQALYPPDILYALYEHVSPRIKATASAFSRTSSRVAGFSALLGKI